MGRPDAIKGLGSLGPFQHGFIKRNATGLAKGGENFARIFQNIIGIDDGRGAPALLGHRIKNFRLLDKADIAQGQHRPISLYSWQAPVRVSG